MSTFFFESRSPVAVILRVLSLPLALPLIVVGQLATEAFNPDGAGTVAQAIGAYIHGQGDDQ